MSLIVVCSRIFRLFGRLVYLIDTVGQCWIWKSDEWLKEKDESSMRSDVCIAVWDWQRDCHGCFEWVSVYLPCRWTSVPIRVRFVRDRVLSLRVSLSRRVDRSDLLHVPRTRDKEHLLGQRQQQLCTRFWSIKLRRTPSVSFNLRSQVDFSFSVETLACSNSFNRCSTLWNRDIVLKRKRKESSQLFTSFACSISFIRSLVVRVKIS